MRRVTLVVACLCIVLLTTGIQTAGGKRMDEDLLCQKLEDCYKSVGSVEKEKGQIFDIYTEELSYLVLVAGGHARGSKRLDAIFSKIQKESPTLAVPRFVMTPTELQEFIAAMAHDGPNNHVYLAYRKKLRYMSEWIAEAKTAITRRSGFKFDPSVPVIHAQ